jgi:hypothetical protein
MSAIMPPLHPATADALRDLIGRIVDEGVARFGGVDGFAAALEAYMSTRTVER